MIVERPSRLLAWVVAYQASCPVLINVINSYISDGDSASITAGVSLLVVLLLALVAVTRGISLPRQASFATFAIMSAAFWVHYFVLSLLYPSLTGLAMMENLPVYALLWIAAPLALLLITRQAIDTRQVFSAMLVVMAAYLALLLIRFVLGLGRYHSGRWSPGEALDPIRVGRYASLAVLIYLAALIGKQTGRRDRLIALIGMGPALFLTVVANARGPWLALILTVVVVAPALLRVFARQLREDVRVLATSLVVAGVAAIGVGIALSKGESNFSRLFDPSQDGGSVAGRVELLEDYFKLFAMQPDGLLSGYGYNHALCYPHNIEVEILSVGGVPLLLLFLAIIGLVMVRGLREAWRGDGLSIVFLGLFIHGMIGVQTAGSVAHEMMPWFAGALVLIRNEELAHESPPNSGAGADVAASIVDKHARH